MIVWLNGPFGVGKTTAATALRAHLPGAREFDPERYGWLLHRALGPFRPADYQQLRLWRHGSVRGAVRRARHDHTLIVPMTVLDPDHLDELLVGIRRRGPQVLHVTLHAEPSSLQDRIKADRDDPGAHDWRLGQLDRYLRAAPVLGRHGPVVDTTGRTPDQVVTDLVSLLPAS